MAFGLGQAPTGEALAKSTDGAISSGQLATTMMLRGAVGTVIGAAVAPRGREGLWAAVGFTMGATIGEVGIIGVALAALWRKAS
jgi:hypothetical protein